MLRIVFACVAIVISELCRGSLGWRPVMIPDQDEIYINEDDTLELTCISKRNITFFYPETVVESITTSPSEIKTIETENEYKYTFLRSKTIYGDAGWYGCANDDVDVEADPTNHDDPEVRWTYVYVKSNISFFVEEDTYRTLVGVSGGNAVIPCRPTSPDLSVILKGNDMDAIELGEKVSYDRKIGFTLKDITLKDSGYFTCSIKIDDMDYEVGYHLHVMRKQKLNKPKILEDTLRHVTRGQNLYVNCTIDVDTDLPYVFNWSTPQNVLKVDLSSRITTRHHRKMIGVNSQRITSELIIHNVTDNDEGDYECIIKTFYDSKKDKKHITVHDPNIKYINLTSQDANRHYQGKYGDRVQCVVYVDAYPQPKLRWFNPKGEEIMETWAEPERTKNAVQITPSSTVLRINRLNVNDMGVYSLQATNEDRIETLNFTLDVLAKPIPILEKVEPYYAPKQIAEIFCHVAASPMPNITWSFLKCPNYPSYEDSSIDYLTNTSVTSKQTSFISKAVMTIEISGHVACTACNELGCDSTNETILVSDGNGGFGIIESTEEVTAGDDLVVICAASVYNYSNVVEWVDEQDQPIYETERLKITRELTPFTYRSTLRIENVQKSDITFYVCSARTADGSIERIDYELKVHDAETPYFTVTNMNQSETTFDLSTEGHKTVILTCFARGMPKPRVTWYKDDMEIKNNEQYLFLHDNQELHIKYLLERDDGKYSCRAENRIDKVETYQQIAIKGKQNPKILIISIVIVVIICCILIAYFSIKAHREKVMRKELMEAGLMHFEEGAVECLNPDLTVDEQAELLPYDKKWEFPRERLKLGKQLGSGAFGVVMKAEAQGICEEEEVTTVAVKMVRRNAEPAYIRALASELKIMVHLGKHLNVVNLLGACTKNICKRELLVIVEYCRFGNLHNYLLRHRANFVNQIDLATGKMDPAIGIDLLTRTTSMGSSSSRIKYAALSFSRSLSLNSAGSNSGTEPLDYRQTTDSQSVSMSPDGCVLSNNSTQPGWRSNYRGDYKDHNLKPICTQDLLSWAFQVARGMEYLSYRKVLHGDLAARNILLAENNVVKICDFGLAKTMYKDDNYEKKGDGPLPIKWMAIESIRDRVFSTQSDVWSFGIVLWEFFTLAETPYPGMQARQQYQKLIEGYRMEQPEYCVREVYDIMLQCWKAKPSLRPTFTELVESIGDLLEQSVKMHYVDLNAPYIDMNTSTLENGKSDYLTMMSAPDHAALSSPICDYVNSPNSSTEGATSDPGYLCMSPNGQVDESDIFSPRPLPQNAHFEFPSPTEKTSVYSDLDDAVELAPMLNSEDNYLKPIDVQQRRTEFARQRQSQNKIDRPMERDSGYCNTPRNLRLIDLNDVNVGDNEEADSPAVEKNDKLLKSNPKGFVPTIIRTQDNYVNMPKQKSDLRKELTDSFSNPSYVMMSNREFNQTRV